MRIYTDHLDRQRLESIATAMGVNLYDFSESGPRTRGKFAGKVEFKFLLRPIREDFRSGTPDPYTKAGVRRIWAVSWAGHYVFMRAVLNADPAASIVTGLAQYHGFHDFDVSAWPTGSRNVGSMMGPVAYRKAQAPEHVAWTTEQDLIAHARDLTGIAA